MTISGLFGLRSCGRAALALCAVVVLSAPLAAQNDYARAPGDNPLRSISRGLKFRHEPAPAPDWVAKTRKPEQETKFLPTGAAARTEPAPVLTQDRLKEIERSLDAERARHDTISGRTAAPAAKRSVAMGPMPKKAATKRACVLTCGSTIGTSKKR